MEVKLLFTETLTFSLFRISYRIRILILTRHIKILVQLVMFFLCEPKYQGSIRGNHILLFQVLYSKLAI